MRPVVTDGVALSVGVSVYRSLSEFDNFWQSVTLYLCQVVSVLAAKLDLLNSLSACLDGVAV